MRRTPLDINGAAILQHPRFADTRGGFERIACRTTLEAAGLTGSFRQLSLSQNTAVHTLRGIHFQREPSPEAKLVRVLRGRLFDVVVDLRPTSATYGRWDAVELAPSVGTLYVPAGCAHGFLTLEPHSEVLYAMSADYDSALQTGVRWDDPELGIRWPAPPSVISDRDAALPTLAELRLGP